VFPKLTMLAGVGIVVGVAYTLRALQKAFHSDTSDPVPGSSSHDRPLEPISTPERIGAVMLLTASLVIGLFPGLLLNWIQPGLNSPLFERLLNGGGL
jgi:NADH-quinone oxidoreductase subunit M